MALPYYAILKERYLLWRGAPEWSIDFKPFLDEWLKKRPEFTFRTALADRKQGVWKHGKTPEQVALDYLKSLSRACWCVWDSEPINPIKEDFYVYNARDKNTYHVIVTKVYNKALRHFNLLTWESKVKWIFKPMVHPKAPTNGRENDVS